MCSVAVGSNARTVKLQSSWYCSNRRVSLHGVSSRAYISTREPEMGWDSISVFTFRGLYGHLTYGPWRQQTWR